MGLAKAGHNYTVTNFGLSLWSRAKAAAVDQCRFELTVQVPKGKHGLTLVDATYMDPIGPIVLCRVARVSPDGSAFGLLLEGDFITFAGDAATKKRSFRSMLSAEVLSHLRDGTASSEDDGDTALLHVKRERYEMSNVAILRDSPKPKSWVRAGWVPWLQSPRGRSRSST
mmetsp:Transcript_47488/g.94843  ORF Transcript_47488/g.94843 Transcript_47488/m.94843 type:complete len:170 (-) Transcript_47488:155-664(-)